MRPDADGRSAVEMYLPRILSHQSRLTPANRADVIDGTLLIEIRQRDMAAAFIDRDGRDRRQDFLDQCQLFLSVKIICVVYHILQAETTKSPAVPCPYVVAPPLIF